MATSHVPLIWPLVRPHIVRVLTRDPAMSCRYRPHDVLLLLLDAKARLWIAWDEEARVVLGAVVTEIINYPTGLRELRGWLVGGRDMKKWLRPGMTMLEEFGRANDCSYMTGGFRKGWLRLGFEQAGITVARAL